MSLRLAQGATLIAEDRLAAAQFETAVLTADTVPERSAWRSPRISTHAAWLADTWARMVSDDRSLLSAPQTGALWRRIVADSPESWRLLDGARIADWAMAAWQKLCDAGVDYRTLRGDAEDGSLAAFLRWAHRFDELATARGWIDPPRLSAELARLARAGRLTALDVVWVEPLVRSPALERLASTLGENGSRATFWSPPVLQRATWQIGLADWREELAAATDWARSRLQRDPLQRIAIVAATDPRTRQALGRSHDWADGDGGSTAPTWLLGESAEDNPAIGAALTCIELLDARAGFDVFSRWLRSPFLGDAIEPRASRCSAEVELRDELLAQLPLVAAYRQAGLRAWLERRVPGAVGVLDVLTARRGSLPHRQSPTRWASYFSDVLSGVGWPGSETPVPQRSLDAWNEILRELAQLSSILGPIDFASALGELRGIVGHFRAHVPLPLHGLCVLPRLEQISCGFDAVWITGMSDRAWPRTAEPNPLLPLRLQAAHEMPLATPMAALSWSRAVTTRAVSRVPELVFSYPAIEDEFAASPSPLIAGFAELPREQLHSRPLRRQGAIAIESIADPAPAFAGQSLRGGARTLSAQARCPLRAFVESRLVAKPLEPVGRGLGPRHRGIATHRALELLMAGFAGRAAMASVTPDDRAGLVRSSSRRALGERAREAERGLRVYVELEHERLTRLLGEFLRAELERQPFEIQGLEIRCAVTLGGLSISCRVDRVDRLSDGNIAIVDYKTGQRSSPLDWLKPRPAEPQLPLYASAMAGELGALVVVAVQAQGITYRGIWNAEGAFPARSQPLPPDFDWAAQRDRWTHELTELVQEYAAGDTRISGVDYDSVTGPFAPLSRVYENLLQYRSSAGGDET